MGQYLPDFADPRWFVCHTKPRCEKKFASLMQQEKFAHYLPLIPSVRRYGTQKKTFTKPLFAGYVFVFGSDEQRIQTLATRRVAKTVEVRNPDRLVKDLKKLRALIVHARDTAIGPLANSESAFGSLPSSV